MVVYLPVETAFIPLTASVLCHYCGFYAGTINVYLILVMSF